MTKLPSGESVVPEPSGGNPTSRLTLSSLKRAMGEADPAAFLVLPRILRRVIKQDRQLVGFGLRVPHRKSYLIDRKPLLEIVEKDELGLTENATLPEKVILLAQPNPRMFDETPGDEILIHCWQLLFHARIHAALAERSAAGEFTPALVRRRIHEIGPAEFDEIRTILDHEDLLLPPRSDESTYVEFVAMYWELRYFAASFLSRFFPGIKNPAAVESILRQDVEVEPLFQTTRPTGAPAPRDLGELDEWTYLSMEPESHLTDSLPPSEISSETKYRVLMRKSQKPASVGNVVRAAVYRARAERCAPAEYVGRVRSAVKMDVYRLIRRLQAALELKEASPQPWQESLFALVNQTPRGIWTVEARLLYDLQKVCVDHERNVYTIDLVEWALTWGRRPIKRPLPSQRDVLMLKHLCSAARRLGAVRVSDTQRRQLARLVHEAMNRVESRLRDQFRPKITTALDEVGLVPRNMPERVARKKLVEELLDQIVERGFLTMGDLRDAISRNKIKLPDLSEPFDFLSGDQLLRADRRLARSLDGVYRRGEFYLRWMQRLSSLAFGTKTGRFLTRFAAVPFGGAYVALAGVHHAWDMIAGVKHPPIDAAALPTAGASKAAADAGFQLTSPSVVLLLGLFLLCLVNSDVFRRAVARFFKVSYTVFRSVVIDPIRRLILSPWLQQILHSRYFTIPFRFIVKPLLWTGVAWYVLPVDESSRWTSTGTAVSFFLAFNLLLNSRPGRTLEEVVADWVVQSWQQFGLRFITGLFWFIIDVFKRIVATIERLMYSVDEWLRFKSGEKPLALAAKAVLGALWFFMAYVVRFAVTVLIEPQINPIKHFPVVTVSHKLLLPLIPQFATVLELTLDKALAWTVAGAVITGIPGVFGFLVWELKENWRLYEANRRWRLGPLPIGPHGETMGRLLKPGLHSGTLPKHYAKLRRAERRARRGGSWRGVYKQLQAIRHVERRIRRHVEREFLELFEQSKAWQSPPVTLAGIQPGANSVWLMLECPGVLESPLEIAVDVQAGWLLAGVVEQGWSGRLPPNQRQVLVTALLGLYKSMGIELVRQQIESEFSQPMPPYNITDEGLVVWPDEAWETEVRYDLHEAQWIAPQSVRGLARRRMPTIERGHLVFSEVPITWDCWLDVWRRDQADQEHPRDAIVPVRVLPPISPS